MNRFSQEHTPHDIRRRLVPSVVLTLGCVLLLWKFSSSVTETTNYAQMERYSNQILSGPDIVSRGFVYVREAEDLMEEAREIVQTAMEGCISHHVTDWGKMKTAIRDTLGEFLWKRTKRRPMILPIIMEVE